MTITHRIFHPVDLPLEIISIIQYINSIISAMLRRVHISPMIKMPRKRCRSHGDATTACPIGSYVTALVAERHFDGRPARPGLMAMTLKLVVPAGAAQRQMKCCKQAQCR